MWAGVEFFSYTAKNILHSTPLPRVPQTVNNSQMLRTIINEDFQTQRTVKTSAARFGSANKKREFLHTRIDKHSPHPHFTSSIQDKNAFTKSGISFKPQTVVNTTFASLPPSSMHWESWWEKCWETCFAGISTIHCSELRKIWRCCSDASLSHSSSS